MHHPVSMPDINQLNDIMMNKDQIQTKWATHGQTTHGELPLNLESTMLAQFDDLVAKGEIMWAPYDSEPVEEQGFKAIFQVAPHLVHKPMEPDLGPTKRVRKTKNPFLDPDPRFIAAMVGPSHTLLQNKYCVYRPSLILHTNHFVPQSTDLDFSDLTAAWDTLLHLRSQSQPRSPPRYMMIYNCGVNAGSSQAHKHMQIWPYPDPAEIGFDLFPSQAKSTVDITDDIAHVPHQHFVLRLAPNAQAADVAAAYGKLLARVRACHKSFGSTAYNVAMTLDWLCLIPRRNCGISRGAGSNTAGMLGLLWILDENEKAIWKEPSLCDYLQYLGVPRVV